MFSKCTGPIVVVLVVSCACDERRSPTGPSDPSAAVTGHVTATNGGQPLAGLVVDVGAQTTGTDASGSNDQQPFARERAHAAIAYARPVGNTDPDTDPSGAFSIAPTRVIH
jgi:hypothetical protein